MAAIIRHANAGDADFLAWVMLSASRGHLRRGVWDLIIGADEAGCLDYLRRLAVAQPRSLCHYEAFWVADFDGVPAAALCAFEFGAGGWGLVAEAMARVQTGLGWTDADVAAAQQRVSPVWSCFLPDAGADCAIENVATRPEYRGRRLAGLLLAEAVGDLKRRRCRLAQITTYIGNDRAQSVYEKAGFSLSDEKRCPEMASVLSAPGFARFLRQL